jgi:hypothetical protein
MKGMKIAVCQNEDMEMRKSKKWSSWPKKIQTGLQWREDVGWGTLLLSSTRVPGVKCIIDGLPSVSFTLPILHFSAICYKRSRLFPVYDDIPV